MLTVLNGLIAVGCMVLLVYAGVVMRYLTRHDGLPPPFSRSVRRFDRADDREQPGDAERGPDDR